MKNGNLKHRWLLQGNSSLMSEQTVNVQVWGMLSALVFFFYNSYCFCEVTELRLVQEAVSHGLFTMEFFGKSWSNDRINSWEILSPKFNLCFTLGVLTQNKFSRSVSLPVWKTPQSKSSICDFLLPEVWCSVKWGWAGLPPEHHLLIPLLQLPAPGVTPAVMLVCMRSKAGCFLVGMAWTCRLSSGWHW